MGCHIAGLSHLSQHTADIQHICWEEIVTWKQNNVPKDMLLNCIFFKRKIYCWGNTHDISCINSQFSLVIAEVSYSQTEFSILAPCTVLLYTGSRTVMHIYVCVYIYIYIYIHTYIQTTTFLLFPLHLGWLCAFSIMVNVKV